MMKISKNLTLKEVMYSQTAIRKGIDNTPTEEHIEKLKLIENIPTIKRTLRCAYMCELRISQ